MAKKKLVFDENGVHIQTLISIKEIADEVDKMNRERINKETPINIYEYQEMRTVRKGLPEAMESEDEGTSGDVSKVLE